tara:strand:+ start:205 stop:474 length:270 start_codon:yes stop_codon:yes gene_type:complete
MYILGLMVNGWSYLELYATPRDLNYINIVCFGVFVFLLDAFDPVRTLVVKQQGQPVYQAVQILNTATIPNKLLPRGKYPRTINAQVIYR